MGEEQWHDMHDHMHHAVTPPSPLDENVGKETRARAKLSKGEQCHPTG